MIYFITGGERSGKSRFAQQLALTLSDHPAYLATARKSDKHFEQRIARHRQERDHRWENIEEEVTISQIEATEKVVVLDCITLWLNNIFTDLEYSTDESLDTAKKELDKAFQKNCTWIIISNEIGMGVHATSEAGRKFVELQGWINQHIAEKASEVYFMVSGLPCKIKPPTR
ncbi:MAG TPA: bifunctional adenosylcobinamide kinase/adenosylcobinamide-phosphate guanylyltransferase [Cyclobacteriaceae bacterium]